MEQIKGFFLLCIALFLGSTLLFFGFPELSSRGEGREALVAQAIVEYGEWILPHGYGGVIPSKPPFLHWLIAFFSLPIGRVTEFTARLPSFLASLAALFFFFSITARVITIERAILSFAVLATSFEWVRATVSCRVDMVHSASLAAGTLALWYWARQSSRGYYWVGVLLLTCAMLAKGPVGIFLPTLILSLVWWWEKTPSYEVIKRAFSIALPPLLASLPWYLLAWMKGGAAFAQKVWYENGARLLGSMEDSPHSHGVGYLVGMFFLCFLPWSALLTVKAWQERKYLRYHFKEFKNKASSLHPLERLAACAVVIIFLFYCLPSSKRSVYLLALYPFLSLFCSRVLSFAKDQKVLTRIVICVFTLVAIGQIGLGVYPLFSSESAKKAAELVHQKIDENVRVLSFGEEFYAVSFYLRQPVMTIKEGWKQGDIIIVRESRKNLLNDALSREGLSGQLVGTRGSLVILQVTASPSLTSL